MCPPQYLQNPYHPLLLREIGWGANLQTDAAKIFLFVPIPAKAKKLGLLSIYKFSLGMIETFECMEKLNNKLAKKHLQ